MADDPSPVLESAVLLHQSTLALNRRLRATRRSGDLTVSRLAVLGLLKREGATSSGTIAERLRVQPQSLTRVLADLERKGLILKSVDPADRRRVQVEITEEGSVALSSDVEDRRHRLAATMERMLSPTEIALLRLAAGLMSRLAEAVEPDGFESEAEEVHD